MRGWRILAAVLLVTTGLAGCIGTSTDGLDRASTRAADRAPLETDDVDVADADRVRDVDTGVQAIFDDVELPFAQSFTVPEGATVVDVRVEAASEDTQLYPALTDADSGADRCTTQGVDGWQGSPTGAASCAGVTAIDPLPTEWQARVSSPDAGGGPTSEEPVLAERVTLHFYDEPYDGVVGDLELSNLSMPHHDVGDTTTHLVESHDGENLFVEVHTPADGHESYPTLLVSTPYNTLTRAVGGQPYAAVVQDYVERGYAVALADVRGFGQSDGCVNVWGEAERLDQARLVEWITEQDFSDGSVGMWGASYPGTTPVEAAVEAPEGLEAIVPVASVVNAYKDWHYGGVPTGENLGSPAAYQAIGTATTPRPAAPAETALDVANGACDATLAADANDPRATYDAFYEERNFSTRADQVEAAVLQQHGFVDGTVKPNVIHNWFDELDTPKLGLLGHWAHNYAVRADTATLTLAWMDQFVKGTELGLGDVSTTSVETNTGYRTADEWPPANNGPTPVYPDFANDQLAANATSGSASILLDPTFATDTGLTGPTDDADAIVLTGKAGGAFGIAGKPHLALDVTLQGAANAYVHASLSEVGGDDERLITYGAVNLAHRGDHSSYEPFAPNERAKVPLPMQPTDFQLEPDDELRLVVEASQATGLTRGSNPGQLVVHGGEDGTVLDLPSLPADAYGEVPVTVDPSPAH